MQRRVGIMSAALAIGAAVVTGSVVYGDPKGEGADPAQEIIEKLVDQLRSASKQAEKSAPSEPSVEPAKAIFEEVESRGNEVLARKARNAELLWMQAKAAEQDGRLAEAIRLAGSARRQDPTNEKIAEYYETLQSHLSRASNLPSYAKAKAHLAAGLTQGQLLLKQGRYVEGLDLLEGVVKGAELFPSEVNVDFYRRLADQQILEIKQRIKSGLIQLDEPIEEEAEPTLVAIGSAAPENARRILRTVESATPSWYTEIKNRLAFRMNVDYHDEAVAVVLEEISKATGVKIIVDEAVQHARSPLNTHIDLRINRAPAETVLDFVCAQASLEYVLMERGVVITTPSRAARYLRDLPESVRDNWAAARIVFPDLTPELLATPALPNVLPGQEGDARDSLDSDRPAFLENGAALVAHIQALLQKE